MEDHGATHPGTGPATRDARGRSAARGDDAGVGDPPERWRLQVADPSTLPSPLVVRVLGRWSVQATPDGPPVELARGAQRQTLAALVANGGGGASADTLADTIWPGELPKQWGPALRMCLSRLRPLLPTDAIPFRPYRLDLPIESVDAWHLAQLAAQADHVPDEADLDWMLAGPPYPDVELSRPLALAAAAAHRAQRRVVLRYAASSPPVVSDRTCDRLEWFVGADPLDESVAVEVGRLLSGADRTGDALHLLRRFSSAYRLETGAVPGQVASLLAELTTGRISA